MSAEDEGVVFSGCYLLVGSMGNMPPKWVRKTLCDAKKEFAIISHRKLVHLAHIFDVVTQYVCMNVCMYNNCSPSPTIATIRSPTYIHPITSFISAKVFIGNCMCVCVRAKWQSPTTVLCTEYSRMQTIG